MNKDHELIWYSGLKVSDEWPIMSDLFVKTSQLQNRKNKLNSNFVEASTVWSNKTRVKIEILCSILGNCIRIIYCWNLELYKSMPCSRCVQNNSKVVQKSRAGKDSSAIGVKILISSTYNQRNDYYIRTSSVFSEKSPALKSLWNSRLYTQIVYNL